MLDVRKPQIACKAAKQQTIELAKEYLVTTYPTHAHDARWETVSQQRLKKQLLLLESVGLFWDPRVFRLGEFSSKHVLVML